VVRYLGLCRLLTVDYNVPTIYAKEVEICTGYRLGHIRYLR